MTAISFYAGAVYSAKVYEGDKLVATLTACSMQQLRSKVKAAYGIKVN